MQVASEKMAGTVVTSENLQAFIAKRLNLNTEESPKETVPGKVEAKADIKADTDEPKKEKSPIEGRFSELTGQRNEARRIAQEEKARADRLEAELAKARGEIPAPKRPDPSEFTDAVKYGEALGEYLAKEKDRKEAEKRAKEAEESERQQVLRDWNKRLNKARKEIDDFADIVDNSEVPILPTVQNAMVESEFGPQIAYFLAKNPDEADKLNGLGPRALERAIGRLEAKFETDTAKPKETAPKAPKKAPEPITPITASTEGVDEGLFDAKGEFIGTPQQWKALRQAKKV